MKLTNTTDEIAKKFESPYYVMGVVDSINNKIDQLRKDVDGLMKGGADKPFEWAKPHFQEVTSAAPISEKEYRMAENTKPERPEKILCAAIRFIFRDGYRDRIYGGISYESIIEPPFKIGSEKGFLTSKNRFVDSKEAYQIHMPKELIISDCNNHIVGELKPEDLL